MSKNVRLIGREREYVNEVLSADYRNSKHVGMVKRAEKSFSELIECKYAIGFTNGTSTLHTALEALGVGIGDEVIVPALTMSATWFSVIHANATPIFADIDPNTFQIDPKSVNSKISDKTKAIITVALYGGSPEYTQINSIRGSNIALIEDNAEAFGAKYRNQNLGTFGDFSSYSFQTSKHLTSGEGGMLCTSDLDLADKARKIQSLGYKSVGATQQQINKETVQNPNFDRHVSLGWNYRLSEIQAAVILGQIENSHTLIGVRVEAANRIKNVLRNCDWLTPQQDYDGVQNSYWTLAAKLNLEYVNWNTFSKKFRDFGGKGFYGAWKLGFQEPALVNGNLLGREKIINIDKIQKSAQSCETAIGLQKQIVQFRTNEWSTIELEIQIEALEKTINFFS